MLCSCSVGDCVVQRKRELREVICLLNLAGGIYPVESNALQLRFVYCKLGLDVDTCFSSNVNMICLRGSLVAAG